MRRADVHHRLANARRHDPHGQQDADAEEGRDRQLTADKAATGLSWADVPIATIATIFWASFAE